MSGDQEKDGGKKYINICYYMIIFTDHHFWLIQHKIGDLILVGFFILRKWNTVDKSWSKFMTYL